MSKLYLPLLLLLFGCLFSLTPARAQAVNFSWARQIDNPNSYAMYMNVMLNRYHSVTVDSMGNVYTAGQFYGTVDFDPGPGTVNLSSGTTIGSSVYITKISPAGNLVWARCLRTTTGYGAAATAITVDTKGNVYIGGRLNDTTTIDYDPGPGVQTGSTTDNNSLFAVKLDDAGNLLWAKQFDGTTGSVSIGVFNHIKSIVVDADQNVYFAGQFNGGVDLDPGPGTAIYTLANPCTNCMNIYVAKLGPSGNFLWGGEMICDSECGLEGLAVDAQANIYLIGNFWGTIDLDPGPGADYNVGGSAAGYIVKLNTAGVYQWGYALQGTGRIWCQALATDITGNVLITGGFNGTLDFDPAPGPGHVYNVTSFNPMSSSGIPYYGTLDGYVLKLNPDGHFVWVRHFGGVINSTYINGLPDNGRGHSIATDRTGAVYTMGTFIDTADFDPGTSTANLTAMAGYSDLYLQKLNAAGDFEWVKKVSNQYMAAVSYDAICLNINADGRGNVYASGPFKNTVDFDPGAGVYNLTAQSPSSNFVLKLATTCPIASSITKDSSCTPYVFGDTTYTASGSYSQHYTGSTGCDSVAILHLKIKGDTIHLADTGCLQFMLNAETYTASGTYTQTYTNSAGCDSVLVLSLVITKPDTAVLQSGRTLNAQQTDADGYRWINCDDNSPMPGATTAQFSPVEDGTYALVVTVDGCSDTSACYQVGSGTTIRMVTGNRVKLYPNPVKDMLCLEAAKTLDDASLRLVDIMGKTVLLQQGLNGRSFRIPTAMLLPGIYFVQLAQGGKVSQAKLVKY